MYFKRLELVGFKSFAQRTVFEFEPGIAAIVGPNGCGKSNIADAIRWVLGEQSARDLRANLMEDVIFNGSSETPPLGMAEVSLTLGDADQLLDVDFNEVTVSRRLFRSGESQYLIHGNPCRLKDVHELFMDTGIGLEAYSYYEQGNVELVLSSKPEERRYIFEEAAGITKYKSDKKAAIRKLEATEENLVRINDIIREVKRQINSINRQASRARRYKELVEELSKYEIGLLLYKREELTKEYSLVTEKHERTKTVLDENIKNIDSKEEEIREFRGKLQGLEADYEQLQSKKLDTLRSIDREGNNIALWEQRMADTKNIGKSGKKQIEGIKKRISEIKNEISARADELENLKSERKNCERVLSAKDSEFSKGTDGLEAEKANLKTLTEKSIELIRKEMEMKNELDNLIKKREENQFLQRKLNEEKSGLTKRLRKIELDEKKIKEEKKNLTEKLGEKKSKLSDLHKNLQELTSRLNDIAEQLQIHQKSLIESQSRYEILKNMKEKYEGYYLGVKNILRESKKEKSALKGIMETVADVIDVQDKFEVAIESALGHRLQYIVARKGDDAKKAIDFLKNKSGGRATFLALDFIKERKGHRREIDDIKEREGNVIGPAVDYVRAKPTYGPIINFLLSKTVIVKDIESALAIARKNKHDLTFVTLDGEVVAARGTISGGEASRKEIGLISRDSQIDKLREKIEKSSEETEKLAKKRDEFSSEINSINSEITKIQDEIHLLDEKFEEREKNSVKIAAFRESDENEIGMIIRRLDEIEKDGKNITSLQTKLSSEIDQLNKGKVRIEEEIAARQKSIDLEQKKVSQIQKELMDLRVSLASFNERISNLETNCKQLDLELKQREKELEKKISEMNMSENYADELDSNMKNAQQIIAELEEEKKNIENSIEKIDEGREGIVTTIAELERRLKENRDSLNRYQDEASKLNLRLTELRFAIQNIDDKLKNEYKLIYDDEKAERLPKNTDWDEVEMRISELKRHKEKIGSVDLFAIEEYDRLQERYNFLCEQQKDLVDSKESLLKVISKINATTKKLFIETFEKIRREFKTVFRTLFGGGKADLILVDESDILESGIDIIASPPEKKLQNISLLSGGEKAMTAISLLFAIFKVRPSPFCILDEMDAPLDDSNIDRFTDTLKEFLDKSQFIVITHNKRTIAMADVLYGITMEDSGISKVVSVRFKKAAEKAS